MNLFTFIVNLKNRPILREISWYGAPQITGQIFSFLGVIITSRYFGPINLGLYSFVQNYVGLFLAIITGMDFYFQWKIARSEDKQKDVLEYFGNKLYISIFLSILGAVLGFLVLPKDLAMMTFIVLVPLCLHACSAFSLYAFATQKAKPVAVLQIVTTFIVFVTKVTLVLLKAPLIAFVVMTSFEIILSSTLIALYFASSLDWKNSIRTFVFPRVTSAFLFLYSIRTSIITMALWQVLLRTDQLILATFSNAYTLGIYASAVKVAEVPNFLASIIYVALVSRVAHFTSKNDDHSKIRMRKVMYSYLGVSSLIAFVTIVTAPILVRILYGSQFLEVIPVLRVYALSIPSMFLFFFFFSVYGMRDIFTHQAIVFALAIVTNAILIYTLTPLFGLLGTAFATVISYSSAVLALYLHSKKKTFIM